MMDILSSRINSDGTVTPNGKGDPSDGSHADQVKVALGNMYMDITCSNCGSNKVIRAGACGCCTECGTSQGCS